MTKIKINQQTRDKLFSTDINIVNSALNSLKEKGNKEYLPVLFDLLLSEPEKEIEKEIILLLGTVKSNDTIPVFVEALKDERFVPIRKNILACCWQNGLDFSNYINLFVDLIVDGEWEVAFEAFTVIENLKHFPAVDEFKETKLRIANALKSANEQKAYFLEEILKITS